MKDDEVKQASRTIAIGDIHGCFTAFETLLRQIELRPEDTLVTLGDYVDRGPDSRRVIERLFALRDECRLVTLLGNHEAMMLGAFHDEQQAHFWLRCGGTETLLSYQESSTDENTESEHDEVEPEATSSSFMDMHIVPTSHVDFLRQCTLAYETETHLFVHANYDPNLPLEEQDEFFLLWKHLHHGVPAPHLSGKTVILGHTPQTNGAPLDLGHVICLDTYCFGGGWLTAFDVESKQTWQANQVGDVR